MRKTPSLFFVLALVLLAPAARAQEAYVELLRSDIRAEKVALVTEAMDLSDSESAAT